MKRIHVLKADAVEWPFGGEPIVRLPGSRHRSEQVDPFPAYPHDPSVVKAAVEQVEAAYPIPEPFAPLYVLLPRDTRHYTNGWTEVEWDYSADLPEGVDRSQRPWRGRIVLSAKRIPPHPAVTRYLVAHEYGHVVHRWFQRLANEREESDGLYEEYARLRGAKQPKSYGGGTWHASTSELFANDFRILVAGMEREFWPHPGIPRPEEVPAIRRYWGDRAHLTLPEAA